MRYHFHEDLNATETTRRTCAVYGSDAIKERVAWKWFARSRGGNFNIALSKKY